MSPKKNVATDEEPKIRKMNSKSKSIVNISDSPNMPKKKNKIIVKLPTKKNKSKRNNINLAVKLNKQLTTKALNIPDTTQPTEPATEEPKKIIFRVISAIRGRPPIHDNKKDSFKTESPSETEQLDIPNTINEPPPIVPEPRKKRTYKKKTNKKIAETLGDSDIVAAEPRKKRAYKKKNVPKLPNTFLDVTPGTPEALICTPDIKVSGDFEGAASNDNGPQETSALFPVPRKRYKKVKKTVCEPNVTSLCEPNQTSLCEPNQTSLCEPNQTSLCKPNQTSLCEPIETGVEIKKIRKSRKRRITNDTAPTVNSYSQLDSSSQGIEVTPKPPRKRCYRKQGDKNAQLTAVESTPQPNEITPEPVCNDSDLPDVSTSLLNPQPGEVNNTHFNVVEDIFKNIKSTPKEIPKKITRPKQVPSLNPNQMSMETYLVNSKTNAKATDTKIYNSSPRLDVTHETDLSNSDKAKDTSLPSKTSNQSFPTSNIKTNDEIETTSARSSIKWRRTSPNDSQLVLNNVQQVENVCIDGLMPKVLIVDFKKKAEKKENAFQSSSSTMSNFTISSLSSSLRHGLKAIEKALSPTSSASYFNESQAKGEHSSPTILEPPLSILYKDLELSSSSTSPTRSSTKSSQSTLKKASPLTRMYGQSRLNTKINSDLSKRSMFRTARSSTSSTSDPLTVPPPTILRSSSVVSMASSESTRPSDCQTSQDNNSPQKLNLKGPDRHNRIVFNQSTEQLTGPVNKSPKQPTVPCDQPPKEQKVLCNPSPKHPTIPCSQSPRKRKVPCTPPPKKPPKLPNVLCKKSPKLPKVPSAELPKKQTLPCSQVNQQKDPCVKSPKAAKVNCIKSPKEAKVSCDKSPKKAKEPRVKSPKEAKEPNVKSPKEANEPCVKSPKKTKQPCVKSPKVQSAKQPTASSMQPPKRPKRGNQSPKPKHPTIPCSLPHKKPTVPCVQPPKLATTTSSQQPKHKRPKLPSNQKHRHPRVTFNESPKQQSGHQPPRELSSTSKRSPRDPTSLSSQSPNDYTPSCSQGPKLKPVPLNKKLQNILDFNLDQVFSDDEMEPVADEDVTVLPCPEQDILTLCSSFKAIPIKQEIVDDVTFEDKNTNSKSYDDEGACSDNDDVLSLYADSLFSELNLNSDSPKQSMFDTREREKPVFSSPIPSFNQFMTTPTSRQNHFRPVPPKHPLYVQSVCKDKDEKTKTICEKQRADSTSVVMNENKRTATDTDSESNYNSRTIIKKPKFTNIKDNIQPYADQTQSTLRNTHVNPTISTNDYSGSSLNNHFARLANQYYTSNLDNVPSSFAVPTSLLPALFGDKPSPRWIRKVYGFDNNSGKLWRNVCIYFLNDSCTRKSCEYEHRLIANSELEKWLETASENNLVQEYIRIFKLPVLRERYIKLFVSAAIRKDRPRIVIEMLFDITINKKYKTTGPLTSEVTEMTLLYFNNKSLDTCTDILTYRENGKTLCQYMLKAIITSQNFSRYKELFVKLTYFILKTLHMFDVQDTIQFLERISILPFDVKVARAMLTMMKHSDVSVMQHSSLDTFEKLISKDETVYTEYIAFKGKVLGLNSSLPKPATAGISNAANVDGKTNTSPDTTNNDVMRNNITVPNLSPLKPTKFSPAETFKPCNPTPLFRHSRTEFKKPMLQRPYTPNYRNNYVSYSNYRIPRLPFRPHYPRSTPHHQFGASSPMNIANYRGPRPGT